MGLFLVPCYRCSPICRHSRADIFALSLRREFNGRVASVCFFAAADAKPLSPPQFAAALRPMYLSLKAIWRLREFLLRNAIPAPSIGGVSAVLRRLQKPPVRSSFLFWAPLGRASNSELLAEHTFRRVPPRKVEFPLA